jgi:hypothetical protein
MPQPGGSKVRALSPSGKAPTTRVRRLISRDALKRIIGADAPPVLAGKGQVRERLGNARRHPIPPAC